VKPFLLAVTLVFVACGGTARDPGAPRPSEVSPRVAAEINGGDSVEGIVIEQPTGRPMRAALVSIAGATVTSDTAGRFELIAPSRTDAPPLAQLLGYRQNRAELFRTAGGMLAILELVGDPTSATIDASVPPLTIEGLVRDSAAMPIMEAQAFVPGSAMGALTRAAGTFVPSLAQNHHTGTASLSGELLQLSQCLARAGTLNHARRATRPRHRHPHEGLNAP